MRSESNFARFHALVVYTGAEILSGIWRVVEIVELDRIVGY